MSLPGQHQGKAASIGLDVYGLVTQGLTVVRKAGFADNAWRKELLNDSVWDDMQATVGHGSSDFQPEDILQRVLQFLASEPAWMVWSGTAFSSRRDELVFEPTIECLTLIG